MMHEATLQYQHIAAAAQHVQEGIQAWMATRLEQAGFGPLPVRMDFPAPGEGSAVVLFPYQVGPEPKLREQSQSFNLMQISYPWVQGRVTDATGKTLPPAWNALGMLMKDIQDWLQSVEGAPSLPQASARQPLVKSAGLKAESIPPPLRAWFERTTFEKKESWHRELKMLRPDGTLFAPPYVGWQTGFSIGINFLALLHLDPAAGGATGRRRDGGLSGKGASMLLPLGLPTLAMLLGALHRERTVRVSLPARPLPELLLGYLEALVASLPPREPLRERLAEILSQLQQPEQADLSMDPVQDLTDETVALIMRALGQPLRPYINFRVRVRLGDGPELGASPSPDMVNNFEVLPAAELERTHTPAGALEKQVGFGNKEVTPPRAQNSPSLRKPERFEDLQRRRLEEQEAQEEGLRAHPLYRDMPPGAPVTGNTPAPSIVTPRPEPIQPPAPMAAVPERAPGEGEKTGAGAGASAGASAGAGAGAGAGGSGKAGAASSPSAGGKAGAPAGRSSGVMLPFSSSGEVLESPPSLTMVAQPSVLAKGPAGAPAAGGAQLPVSSVTEVRSATLSQGLMSPPIPPAGVGGAGAGGAGAGGATEPRPAASSARGVQLPVSASEGRAGIAPGPVGPPTVAAPEVRGASASMGLRSPPAPTAEGKAGMAGTPATPAPAAPATPEVRGAGQSLGLRSPPRPMVTESRGSGTRLGAGGAGAGGSGGAGEGAGSAGSGASEPKTGFGPPGRPPMPSLRGVGPRPSAPTPGSSTPGSSNPTTSNPAEGNGAERPPLRDRPAFGLKKE
ncbi:MAG: hypothetical protein ACKO6N_11205 [Myxococcota bacterium]